MKVFVRKLFLLHAVFLIVSLSFSQSTPYLNNSSDTGMLNYINSNAIHIDKNLIPYIIMVEKKTSKIYIYSNDKQNNIIKSYYCSTGINPGEKVEDGDMKTPEGIYFFTTIKEENQLIKEYGRSAQEYGKRAYVINYPNKFDRIHNKDGDGIWLHATNNPERLREPYNTRGCVVVTNYDIIDISKYIIIKKTPFVIVNEIKEHNIEVAEKEKDELFEFIEKWEKSWESGNIEEYIKFYSDNFVSRGMNLNRWKNYKARLFRIYRTIDVSLSGLSILEFKDDYIICFNQNFKSEDYQDSGFKRMYIRKEEDKFKIIGEEWFPYSYLVKKVLTYSDHY